MTDSKKQGLLIMAANALGLSEDIPLRSLEAVRQADMLIFEEDRPARMVLKAAGVHKEYFKYNEQSQSSTLEHLYKALKEGKTVVYMSDQGCPTLEDPGREIVNTARRCKAKTRVIPGPSSVTAALSACPFSTQAFEFNGFPPRDEYKRKIFLNELIGRRKLQIIMDTPYRMKHLLANCAEVFSESLEGFLALDITGEDEDYICGTFKELSKHVENIDKKLNFVLIINAMEKPHSNKRPTREHERDRRNKNKQSGEIRKDGERRIRRKKRY